MTKIATDDNPALGVRLLLAVLVALCLSPLLTRGADVERDRKARVALALAGAGSPAITSAPAPRVVIPKDYATGYRLATAEQCPLVVFVGTDPKPVPGAVACRYDAPAFGAIEGPAVVVTYPVGSRLLIEGAVAADAPPEAIVKKIDAAKRKIDAAEATKDTVAPKPLEWDIRAPNGCRCGPGCLCLGTCRGCSDKAIAAKPDPRACSVQVESRKGFGSGVCVATEGGKSLILSNNHVFAEQTAPGTRFPLAAYPTRATVHKSGKEYDGYAVAGCDQADIAIVVVDGVLPVADLAAGDAEIGTACRHYGYGSGGSEGEVRLPPERMPTPEYWFSSTCRTRSGDSGCAMFDGAGRVIAIHNGGGGGGTYGAPVSEVLKVLRANTPEQFVGFRKRLGSAIVPIPVKEPAKPKAAPKAAPDCPDGNCPLVRPAAGTSALQPAGTLTTTSGRLIRPNGRGGYEYADQGASQSPPAYLPSYPFGAPSCPGGNCPAPRR